MATALQKQLAAIAATSTHQLDLKAQKSAHAKSLLFDSKVAATQSFESLYQLCLDGYRDLCALDSRFLHFSKSLFSAQSKDEDRTQMTADENKKLNAVLDAFITLAGPRLLLKPAQKALEWLVRRFRVHEYNTECLTLTYLPYHGTPQFLALLSILPSQPPPSLRFLHPYIQSPTNPPRRTIVYTAVNTPAFFDALQAHAVRVVQAGHQASLLLSFWSGITLEAVVGILDNSSTGRREMEAQKTEELVLRVLPALNSCMRCNHGAETTTACYTIVAVLVGKADLGPKVLDGLMEAVVLAHDVETLHACLACLALIAEQRSDASLPVRVEKRLLATPQIAQELSATSKQCRVDRLALGCAIGALGGMSCSNENAMIFYDLLTSGLLSKSHTCTALSTLLAHICDDTSNSQERGPALEMAAKVAEVPFLLDVMRGAARSSDLDLDALGINIESTLPVEAINQSISDDEDMLGVDDSPDTTTDRSIEIPCLTLTSFLEPSVAAQFDDVAEAFSNTVLTNCTNKILKSPELNQKSALEHTRYLSFLARVWSSSCSVPVRVSALRATTTAVKKVMSGHALQNLIPYLLSALSDPSAFIRRSASACIVALSKTSSADGNSKIWGASDLYGKSANQIPVLKVEDCSSFLTLILVPILEESIMDSNFAVGTIKELLEGTQRSKTYPKHGLKAQTRNSVLTFLSYHTSHTPLLRVRLSLLPLFNFQSKASDTVRNNTVLPLLQNWSTLSAVDASALCAREDLLLADVERKHLDALVIKEGKSVQFLRDIITGTCGKERLQLITAAFDCIRVFWAICKAELRLAVAQDLLKLASNDDESVFDRLCRERALEILQNVKLDSAILVTFLESVPSAVQMPEGPPAKKRRRTSRNEMARVELSSQDDVQKLLRKLTIVLELIEGSKPGQHPALFRSLFGVFGELQLLKQQSGSELVYLQSTILSSLTPIVETLKQQSDTAEYQSAVRADLLTDCIRHSSSPQVQNSALLLIANLASWVPELILHNLMPIFTFIGSTLLRQQDDYSAQVVDKTILRVVPQLAASLRSKHKNFLSGVSDLLLSFTAAFEHIPLHRRLKLFSELARTLGPEDSLSAILALLADRYHNSKSQRRFSIDLLLAFDPMHTLDAFKGYLELVIDAASPKRKVSDLLFGLNEKNAQQIESSIKGLLASLADLATDERLREHVTKAFRGKNDAATPRVTFASIVESTIQLSRKVTTSPKLYDGCSRVLARCLDLLPTMELIKSVELLLSNSDHQVQIAAIKSVEVRAGKAAQNDRKSVATLISFLPGLEMMLQQSQEADAKLISISCVDRIVERFGKKDVAAAASVAQTIAGAHALSDKDDRVRVLSLLCLTSIIDILEDEAISLLPTILPTAFEYLSDAIQSGKEGLHNAVYTLLSNIIEKLGYMFSRDYLETGLRLSHGSAAAVNLNDSCTEAREGFYTSVSGHLSAPEVFSAIQATWPHAISQEFNASLEHLKLVQATIENQNKSQLIKASATLFSLLLQLFNMRQAIGASGEQEFEEEEEINQLDELLVESTLAMVSKLNDATFRPFFVQLVDQEGASRNLTMYKFLAGFFDKFKSIVTGYASYVMEQAADLLAQAGQEEVEQELMEAVLEALQRAFQHDQDGFWQAPSHYGAVLKPLSNLLSVEDAVDSREQVIDCIVELAASSSSSVENHGELNTILLRYMRHDSASTRLATVLCEQALTQRLGEEWLGLLPEMLPFISELRDDDSEMVERETQKWISMVEGVLGESLEGMLQ